jgi:hypothetical protein
MACSRVNFPFYSADDPQTLGATAQNFAATATWSAEFAHPRDCVLQHARTHTWLQYHMQWMGVFWCISVDGLLHLDRVHNKVCQNHIFISRLSRM